MKNVIAIKLLRIAREIVAGGTAFSHFVRGTDANIEFNKLVRKWNRIVVETDGYSGTIADKEDFEIVSEPVSREEAEKIAKDKIRDAAKFGPAFCIPVDGVSGKAIGFLFFGVQAS